MFTGLVQAVGRVQDVRPDSHGLAMRIHADAWNHHPAAGDSIAVSGVCLTLVRAGADGVLCFDIVPQTLAKSTLGRLRPGDQVNLEHAARADTLMGGHMVQGHVDGTGVVGPVKRGGGEWRVTVVPPAALMPLIAAQGSIAVDGVSLTVASVTRDAFEVALIPVTLERTTMGALREGDACNIETDIIARQVARYLEARQRV